MNSGRLNIIIGGIVLILAGLGGFSLGFTMDAYFEKGFYALPLGRLLVIAATLTACLCLFTTSLSVLWSTGWHLLLCGRGRARLPH